MHLAIDVREAVREKPTGKGVWVRGFLSELLKREIGLTLFTDAPIPQEFLNAHVRAQVCFPSGLRWHFRTASWLRHAKGIDAYLSPTSYIVPALLSGKFPCIPVVHDLIAFRDEPHDRKATLIERLTLKRAISKAPLICTVS